MSDYQKLKLEHEKLKEENQKNKLRAEQLENLLATILNYNEFVKNKIIRLINLK